MIKFRFGYNIIPKNITKLHSSHLKTALIQCLEIVQRKQPGILATTGVPDPKRPGVSRPWRELVSDLMPTVAQEAAVMRAGGRMLSEEERLMRKKMFVLLTIPKDESLEGIYCIFCSFIVFIN